MKTLAVAFLWHMHQPLYKDLDSGKYHLPWVRLHSTYSYLDMASILKDHPDIKGTFNITPSLMYQLKDISLNENVSDVYLDLCRKNARQLTEEDKVFMLKNFFSCNFDTAIKPMRRYKEIFYMRGNNLDEKILRDKMGEFDDQDFLDLQVFFNLAWCGFTLRNNDDVVKALIEKGENFSEQEKSILLKRQREVVASILPIYKNLQDKGQIEVSTTPYYHPILPLLYSKNKGQGLTCKEDAVWHVKKAIQLYEEVFDRKPVGMWPAEGAVSKDIIPILASQGIKWIATDEGIILKTFKDKKVHRDDLVFTPFTVCNGFRNISMVFRDINLSNAISFTYSHMPPVDAAKDLFNHIIGISNAVRNKKGDNVVSIILDGENPWPYYSDGGKEFLSGLYRLLSSSRQVETVNLGEYLRGHKKRKIHKLASGSWINSDFSKWIGSPQKNRAWELLKKTREDMFSGPKPKPEALEELYIAEGSDWFWWYDEFGTELNFVFDELFRMHLQKIYEISGKDIPEYLKWPICGKELTSNQTLTGVMPAPVIDGRITDGSEWTLARVVKTKDLSMEMVKTDSLIEEIGYGVDAENMYLMVRPVKEIFRKVASDENASVEISIDHPESLRIDMRIINRRPDDFMSSGEIKGKNEGDEKFESFLFKEILEAKIPFSSINVKGNDRVNFRINLKIDDLVKETWPSSGSFDLIVPGRK